MTHMLIRHKVQDFDKWKPLFDGHREDRAAASLKDLHLWRNIDDPNEIVILFEVSDMTKAKAFAESADLKERMRTAGVMDSPDVFFLSDD